MENRTKPMQEQAWWKLHCASCLLVFCAVVWSCIHMQHCTYIICSYSICICCLHILSAVWGLSSLAFFPYSMCDLEVFHILSPRLLLYLSYFLNEKKKLAIRCTTLKVVAQSSACLCICRKYQVWSLELCAVEDVFAKEQFQYVLCCFISTWKKEHISTHWPSTIAYFLNWEKIQGIICFQGPESTACEKQ